MGAGRKHLVAGLVAAVAGSSAVAAWALSSDDAPQRACDEGAIVYMYEAGKTGPLSLDDCPDR